MTTKEVTLDDGRRVELAPTSEIEKRDREVLLLMNVIQPDPYYQSLLTDESTVFHILMNREEVDHRLAIYFGFDTHTQLDLDQPIWKLVDQIKTIEPGWP